MNAQPTYSHIDAVRRGDVPDDVDAEHRRAQQSGDVFADGRDAETRA